MKTARTAAFCAPCARAAHPRRDPAKTKVRAPPSAGALAHLSVLFERAGRVRCPFWRRRATDALEAAAMVVRWGAARHASLPIPVCATDETPYGPALSLNMRIERMRIDFEKRQYYVTGRLSRELYHPMCVFDGPDPDTPVTGTAKWVSATGGLFDQRASRVDLLKMEILESGDVRAYWRLEGVLALPWRPPIKPFLGTTTYSFDEQGLVCEHMETWSVSALDAFVSVVWPTFGKEPAPPVEMCRDWSGDTLSVL